MKSQRKVSESFGSNHSVWQERGGRPRRRHPLLLHKTGGWGRPGPPPARLQPPRPRSPAPLSQERGCRGAEGPCANVLTASLCSPELATRTKRVRDAELGTWSPSLPFSAPSFFFFFFF